MSSCSNLSGYLGSAIETVREAITLEHVLQVGSLMACAKIEFGSIGSASWFLLPLVLVNAKMGLALVGKVLDCKEKAPEVFGNTRTAWALGNIVPAGLVSVVAAETMANESAAAAIVPGITVLGASGLAYVGKRLWKHCCGESKPAASATEPAP